MKKRPIYLLTAILIERIFLMKVSVYMWTKQHMQNKVKWKKCSHMEGFLKNKMKVCLYMQTNPYMQKKLKWKNGWPLTATGREGIFFLESECLYVEEITYAK